MIVKVNEYPAGFWLILTPESQADAALLVRMKLNRKTKPAEVNVFASNEGINAQLVIPTLQRRTTNVPSPKGN